MTKILTTECTEGTEASKAFDERGAMKSRLRVYNLPREVDERELAGNTVIVIDVLRATSTICQALASGAREVVPFRTIEETLAAAEGAGRDRVVLGGERGGRRIAGFDVGNSPREYTPAAVGGRAVYLTTTNGTQALYHARQARRVMIGSLLNLSAVAASIEAEPCVEILCAGTDGEETREDILAAGAIVGRLCNRPAADWRLNDAAAMAGAQWSLLNVNARAAGSSTIEQLAREFRDTPGGRNLLAIGLDDDLVDCAQVDRLSVAPEFDTRERRIRA
jgi:2-phosphosulfolactate phosphatase